MTLLVMLLTTATAWADDGFNYIGADGSVRNTWTDNHIADADVHVLTDNTITDLNDGWYVMRNEITFNTSISIGENVNLILADNARIIANGSEDWCGIGIERDLTIYAQSTGNSQGSLTINKGIYNEYDSNVTINGGTIYVNDYGIRANELTINGGNVSATNTDDYESYGIDANNFTVNGGSVNASGEYYGIYSAKITINGGIVTANGNNGGIYSYSNNGYGYITINGGYVNASSNSNGIYTNGDITLKGGNVIASGGNLGYGGIVTGGDLEDDKDGIILSGATVTATYYGKLTIAEGLTYTTNGTNEYTSSSTTQELSSALGNVKGWPFITYLDANGEKQTCKNYTLLTDGTDISSGLDAGWYVVQGNVNYSSTLEFNGETHLILSDDANLSIIPENDGTGISASGDLTIYSQSNSSSQGSLTINTSYHAGIYGDDCKIIINGGKISTSGYYGIETYDWDYDDYDCDITINGGNITANGLEGNGINALGNITINGGTVIATGYEDGIHAFNDITINGGSVTIISQEGGDYPEAGIFADGVITLNGGTVISIGTDYGIGSNYYDGTIILAGATVTASRYSAPTVAIADNYTYTDGNNLYEGYTTFSNDKLSEIAGLTLHPIMANLVDGNYWTTFYCGDYKYALSGEACAYTATYDAGTLTLNKLGKVIPQGTAVIIVASGNGTDTSVNLTLKKSEADVEFPQVVSGNKLLGVDVRTDMSTLGSGTFYVMGKKGDDFGFFKYTGAYMPAHKAYLRISGNNEVTAPNITMVFDDATGIKSIEKTQIGTESDAWYSLDGRKLLVKPTTKGIYINNGNKVVIK